VNDMFNINSRTFALMLRNIVQLGILLLSSVANLFQCEVFHRHLALILPNIELREGYPRLMSFPVSRPLVMRNVLQWREDGNPLHQRKR